MDRYHEMVLTGSKSYIDGMRSEANQFREEARILVAKAELLDHEARGLEKLMEAWVDAMQAIKLPK